MPSTCNDKIRKMGSKRIVVVGSCMVDFVSYASRLPLQGETIHGHKFATNFGGKGANQCIAAAKLGGETLLVAKVGEDEWGDKYIENLNNHNVLTEFIRKEPNESTGIAQIIVSDQGQNQIVIVAGANNHLTVHDVENAKHVISEASVVILQLETSVKVALRTLELCNKGISILNGAPALEEYDLNLLQLPTMFCVNESEASIFTNLPVTNLKEGEIAARYLIYKGCQSVLLTMGAQGVLYLTKENDVILHVDCPKVNCVDSTGAGDAFIGALAYILVNYNLPMKKVLEAACFIASDSVTRRGTQISFASHAILTKCSLTE